MRRAAAPLAALLLVLAAFPASAAWGVGDDSSSWPGDAGRSKRLERFDIDAVVTATTQAMADAARDYYLPEGKAPKKAVARYQKDARRLVSYDSTFRRELARVVTEVAGTADAADSPEQMYSALPAAEERPNYVEGVSSISWITVEGPDGPQRADYTNTMPCINAAAKAMFDSTLAQFPEVAKDPKAKAAYGRGFGQDLTGERLYNHVLAEVCMKLVKAARDEAGGGE
ncbi:MAG: hypothetical protein KGL53_08980 [Elusimicrobia bacterium]|nr:hypothetical protein [Elusimicrobiota bacterium]